MAGGSQNKQIQILSQLKEHVYSSVFDQIQIGGNSNTEPIITDEDIKIGFQMFSAIVYCSEPVALSKFLHNLVALQSPRTIIQATVNTIQSDDIKDMKNRERLNQFVIALDNIFSFQLGLILMATASPSQLKAMMAADWPYFHKHSQEIDQCLNHENCSGVKHLFHDLGKETV